MPAPREAQILALAARQQRSVTRQQLLRLGLGPWAIGYRVRQGRLHRAYTNVYTVGPPPATPVERAAAAVLACGTGAVLSHRSGLALWGLAKQRTGPVHVTAPGQRRRPGIAAHVSHALTRADVRVQLGIPITSPARTVLDSAPELGPARLPRVIDDARIAGLLHLAELDELLRRVPRHPGRAAARAHLDGDTGPTRSEFERAFLAFCQRFALPRPLVNIPVAGFEADALFAAERLVVELDGWRYHQGRPSFEDDRERDAARLAAGIATYRLTWRRLMDTPEREAERLRAVLATRRSE